MESELQILSGIEENNSITQRDLARRTGLSLGNVNILIKRLVKKGFLEIERLNTKTIRYILTPQGVKEKAIATYEYIVHSYPYIEAVNLRIDKVIKIFMNEFENRTLVLFGDQDEVYQMITVKLIAQEINFANFSSAPKFKVEVGDMNYCILAWHPDFAEILQQEGISFCYILEGL